MKNTVNGFTLIELLVVISVIALLASVILVALNNTRVKSRSALRLSNLNQLTKALELYQNTYGQYPSTSGSWRGESATYGSHTTAGPSGWIPSLAPEFIVKLPTDPNSQKTNSSTGLAICGTDSGQNVYLYRSDGIDYKIIAHCLPENFSSNFPIDPARPSYSWAVFTPGARTW